MRIEKRAITLLEMMIVIFIIGLIGSVIGVNMKGSLDRGRAFKSEQGSKLIHDALTLKIAEGISVSKVLKDPAKYLDESGFVKNPDKALQDGWNEKYEIKKISNGDFIVRSKSWERFLLEKKKLEPEEMEKEYPWAFHFDDPVESDEEETDS